jgi:hypothetical protein
MQAVNKIQHQTSAMNEIRLQHFNSCYGQMTATTLHNIKVQLTTFH